MKSSSESPEQGLPDSQTPQLKMGRIHQGAHRAGSDTIVPTAVGFLTLRPITVELSLTGTCLCGGPTQRWAGAGMSELRHKDRGDGSAGESPVLPIPTASHPSQTGEFSGSTKGPLSKNKVESHLKRHPSLTFGLHAHVRTPPHTHTHTMRVGEHFGVCRACRPQGSRGLSTMQSGVPC